MEILNNECDRILCLIYQLTNLNYSIMKSLKNVKNNNSLSSNRFLSKIKSKVIKIQNRDQVNQLISNASLANG